MISPVMNHAEYPIRILYPVLMSLKQTKNVRDEFKKQKIF